MQRALDAALELATAERGFRPTIQEVSARAKVSVGSLYHHFGSQQRLTFALYQRCLDAMLRFIADAVIDAPDAEIGVKAMVRAYLEFVEAHPAEARFIYAAAHTELVDEFRGELVAHAAHAVSPLAEWVRKQVAAGALVRLPEALYEVVLIGAAAEAARRILAGNRALATRKAREQLAEQVWRSVAPRTTERRRRLTSTRRARS